MFFEDLRPEKLVRNCHGLTTDCLDHVVLFGQRFDFWHEQPALFQQPAEIFFARVTMFAFAGLEIFENFVRDLEAFQMDDTDVFVSVFPHLPLFEFQRHVGSGKPSLRINRGETVGLFFLAGGLFAGDRRFFLGVGAFGHGLFLAGLLLVRFRGFIAHNI